MRKKVLTAASMIAMAVMVFAGCSQASRVSSNLSKEDDKGVTKCDTLG